MGSAGLDGIFRSKYSPITGIDWIRRIEPEDRQFFIRLGMQAWDYGKLGGKARAASATRDKRGRFIREESNVDIS